MFLALRGSRVRWSLTGTALGQPPSGKSATGRLLGPQELNRSLGGVGDADALLGADALLLGGGVLVGGLVVGGGVGLVLSGGMVADALLEADPLSGSTAAS